MYSNNSSQILKIIFVLESMNRTFFFFILLIKLYSQVHNHDPLKKKDSEISQVNKYIYKDRNIINTVH